MSVNQSNHSPAGAILVALLVSLLLAGFLLAGSAAWMTKQELSQSAVWPLATVVVCISTFAGGWISAFLQKNRGLVCGAIEGLLMIGILFSFLFIQGGTLTEMQELRYAMTICAGCTGGFCEILRAERRRHVSK